MNQFTTSTPRSRPGSRWIGPRGQATVLGLANELLLLPDEIKPGAGAYLGNYPLALSQAGRGHAVLEVQEALDA